MNTQRPLTLGLASLLLGGGPACGQDAPRAPDSPSLPPPDAEEPTEWSFAASVFGYLVPDSQDYLQPTFAADRGWLHLEARYNYENLETGSVWFGYNFGGGRKLEWELTPLLGGVFGETDGVAPGYKGALRWWRLELYSEGEFLFDAGDSADSFFYNWSELSLSPLAWFRLGLVAQRTRVYESDLEIQRGFLAGVSYRSLDLTAYVFNPDESQPTFVLGLGVSF